MKLLPLMLGKLFGGCMAIIGFTAVILIETHHLGWSSLPYIITGCGGIFIFYWSSKLLARKQADLPPSKAGSERGTSLLAWGLLLLMGEVLLLWSYFSTR